jgi:glycosyltransferase involved in cell wall biosynthesis
MEPVKNHDFMLRVFNHLARHLAGTPVLFIGGAGSLRSHLEQERDRYGLQDQVFMPGQCTNAPELLGNLFDCFVLPSKAEGLPVTMIEAVAAGLHVVCADAITKDVAKTFPDRITMLPLSAPLERWAEAIEDAIQRRIPPEQGLELVRHSPMTFKQFTEEIIEIYEGASGH